MKQARTGAPRCGQHMLNAHLNDPGRSARKLADATGLSEQAISSFRVGKRVPSVDSAWRIECATAIPMKAWAEEFVGVTSLSTLVESPSATSMIENDDGHRFIGVPK